jgi:glycerol-3-phosphate cytidylyltransferase-like family protein
VIALGHDQTEMEQQVRKYVDEHNLSIKVVRIGKFEEDALDSSSKIRQRIMANFDG